MTEIAYPTPQPLRSSREITKPVIELKKLDGIHKGEITKITIKGDQ